MRCDSSSHEPSKKPLMRVLQGEAVWPPPLWLMRQAGRYLPEFQAHRQRADFLTRCMTPDIAIELTCQPIRRYAMDGAILFSDILILPWALGQKLAFIEGKGPVLEPLRDRKRFKQLQPERVFEFVAPIRQTLSLLRHELPSTTTLLGFAGSPFTVACYMVDGQTSRDFAVTRRMALEDSALFDDLIALLVQTTIDMLIGQIDAGAEAVMLFDSWAGILPPSQFRHYVMAPTRAIVAGLRCARPQVKIIGFPRLAGLMAIDYAQETDIDALACDTSVPMKQLAALHAHNLVQSDLVESGPRPRNIALQGNLDPLILRTGGRSLKDEARQICLELREHPHIFNLGHGVLPDTNPDHVAQLVETVRSLG